MNKPGLGLKFWPGRGPLAAIDKAGWTPAEHFADFVSKVGASVFLGIVPWPCLSLENGTDFLGPDCYQIALALSAVYRRNSVQRQLQQSTSKPDRPRKDGLICIDLYSNQALSPWRCRAEAPRMMRMPSFPNSAAGLTGGFSCKPSLCSRLDSASIEL
jgi:hypothetical protein